MSLVSPRAEWRQIFNDVYRFERDYFYDPNMHGVDWTALRARYGELMEDAVTRWDVDFVLGEFIGELNASHTYHGGGDLEDVPQRNVGMLGVDWELSDGAYRVTEHRAGAAPGTDAALDFPLTTRKGRASARPREAMRDDRPRSAIDTKTDPWAAFQGLGKAPSSLTVSSSPSATGARQVT